MRRTVLIVEDDERLARAVDLMLSSEGFEVRRTATAEDGLAAIADRGFDMVCST